MNFQETLEPLITTGQPSTLQTTLFFFVPMPTKPSQEAQNVILHNNQLVGYAQTLGTLAMSPFRTFLVQYQTEEDFFQPLLLFLFPRLESLHWLIAGKISVVTFSPILDMKPS